MKATWNDALLAESDATVELEGNHYFPASSVDMDHLEASRHKTTSPEKGEARYYHVVADGETNENAAWYYPNPKGEARGVEDCIAFGNGVDVSE